MISSAQCSGHLAIVHDGRTPDLYGVYDRANSCWVTEFYSRELDRKVFAWSPCLNFVVVSCIVEHKVLVYPAVPKSRTHKHVTPVFVAFKLIRQGDHD